MKEILNYRFEFILFIVEAICMILEMVASRLLSPYFGSGNTVWTAVIAIILLSASIGNFFGGKLADKSNSRSTLQYVLFVAGILIMLIPIIEESVLINISESINEYKIGAMLSTTVLFLAPSIVLGLIPPIILKLRLKDVDTAGQTSGKISAISTIGSILGTVLGGFFLVPTFGSKLILFILPIILFLLVFVVEISFKRKMSIAIIILTIITILLTISLTMNIFNVENKVLAGETKAYASYDSEYNRIRIYNGYIGNDKVRVFETDSGYESIMYLDPKRINEPYSAYIKLYDIMFDANANISKTLMIGRSRIHISKTLSYYVFR